MPGRNREQKRKARHSQHWCKSCDRALVSDGAKCRCCGVRALPKRSKS